MRYFTAAVVGAVMSAGATQAAVYQYDVTMDLTRLGLKHGYFTGWGDIPDWLATGECQQDSDSWFGCDLPTLDIRNHDIAFDSEGFDAQGYVDRFEPILTASLLLDSNYYSDGGMMPVCDGSSLLCDPVNSYSREDFWLRSATSQDFAFGLGRGMMNFEVSSAGIAYVDDGNWEGTLDGVRFGGSSGGWIEADYETTSLNITEIAPVLLPASLPLLGVGMAAVGFVARRRKGTSKVRAN